MRNGYARFLSSHEFTEASCAFSGIVYLFLSLSFLVNELRRFRKHPEGVERECFPFRKRCGLYLSNSRLIFGLIRRGPEDASMNIHVKHRHAISHGVPNFNHWPVQREKGTLPSQPENKPFFKT